MKREDEAYKSKFWFFFDEYFEMMGFYMVANVRKEVGMVVEDDGKFVRCYFNNLELMNNVMRFVKETFFKENFCIL